MALNNDLLEQQEIESFVKGKNTRQIAVTSIIMWNRHEKICAERWGIVTKTLRWIAIGIGFVVISALADNLKSGILHDLCEFIRHMVTQ